MHPSEKPVDVESQARDRYAELVDKKFSSSLSEDEGEELARLQVYLDEADAKFYQPIERRLESTLTQLRRKSLKR